MTKLPAIALSDLYEQDFLLWTETTANLLRSGKFTEIDIPNLIEEIESMGRSEKRELKKSLHCSLNGSVQVEISTRKKKRKREKDYY